MVIPSIDLLDNKVVQLRQGRDKVLEQDNALDLIRIFDRCAQTCVVDLNAAQDQGDNQDLIRQILQRGECRVGGGVRDLHRARQYLGWGAEKIIVGSQAFAGDRVNHAFLQELKDGLGPSKIIIALDARSGRILTRAWTHETSLDLLNTIRECEPYCSEFLYTCVEKEGGMNGTDLAMVRRLIKASSRKITVAGGITTLEDVRELSRLGVNCQIGMSLYTGRLDLNQAFMESLDWNKGLIPTIAQDENGRVLNLCFSSRKSLQKTFDSGTMWYYSRSRRRLWHKGETSGHYQELLRIRTDCDRDTLLVQVRQQGMACHEGNYSCFGGRPFDLAQLRAVIGDRLANPAPGSYTARLSAKRLREKIIEEAGEVTTAQTREELIWEIADVMYFLTVLMAQHQLDFQDIISELRRRRWQ